MTPIVDKKTVDHADAIVTDSGTLKFHFKLHSPECPNPELPDPPYIFIDWIEAKPIGKRLLLRHAVDVIARIRVRLGSDRSIIFQPANGEMGNDEAQERLVAYYRLCGFDYLPSSDFWMTWRGLPMKKPNPNVGDKVDKSAV